VSEPTDHDQLFKTVIREDFADFLPLFFAEVAARFDLSAVRWLDKELFTNPPSGPRHVLDLVAELTTLGGDATALALVHVEVESADSVTSIEGRLPEYYHYLRRTTGKPVQPIVVFLKVGLDGLGTRPIHDPPTGEPVMTYRYKYVGLPALPAADYLRGDNPVGVALSALMRVPKGTRVASGVEAIRRITTAPISDGKKHRLADLVEAYIDLPPEELARFHGILEANATGRVPPMNKTRVQIAEERGIEKGREEGMEKGLILATRAAVLELLEARFGPVPVDLVALVAATDDLGTLRRWLRSTGIATDLLAFRATLPA